MWYRIVWAFWRIGEGDQREWMRANKNSSRNMAYIPKSTRRPSVLTWPRPHSYSKAIGLQNRVRNRNGNMKQCQQDHVRDWWQKSDRRIVYILTCISPNTWWTRSRNHRGSAIQTRKSRVFWSGDSRMNRLQPATTTTTENHTYNSEHQSC
jgi:hypothetical protein